MKKQFLFSVILFFITIQTFAANGTMKGDGSAEKPFEIEDYGDLKAIGTGAYLYSSKYVVTKDIDASASKKEQCDGDGNCKGFMPIGKNKDAADSSVFGGTIDGKNHTIRNLKIYYENSSEIAFIVDLRGSVVNLNFDSLSVTGTGTYRKVGGVASRNRGEITNVHVTNGFVHGYDRVGGIAGLNDGTMIKNASFQGVVKGHQQVGGIAGSSSAMLDSVFADVNVSATESQAGGIVGDNEGYIVTCRSSGALTSGNKVGGVAGSSDKEIIACVSTVDILQDSTSLKSGVRVGGIVGENFGSVRLSYANGKIEGYEFVGGVAGDNEDFVENSYALGSVKGEMSVGGLVGKNDVTYFLKKSEASIFTSYAANVVEGREHVGGLIGNSIGDSVGVGVVVSAYWDMNVSGLDSSAGGTGLATGKMKNKSSFVGWDTLGYEILDYDENNKELSRSGKMQKIWDFDEGVSYPHFDKNFTVYNLFLQDIVLQQYFSTSSIVKISHKTLVHRKSLSASFYGANVALRFEIPAAAAVKFSLVDMQGCVVRAFNLGNRTAGTHFETHSVENLPRGRYVGVLQVNGRATEKTMLLKK